MSKVSISPIPELMASRCVAVSRGFGAASLDLTCTVVGMSAHCLCVYMRVWVRYSEMLAHPIEGFSLEVDEADLFRWRVLLTGAAGTLYEGEQFKLKLTFSPGYVRIHLFPSVCRLHAAAFCEWDGSFSSMAVPRCCGLAP